ncbi:uncharacterized protein DNG_07060 [Cephalotrichum gorgonifer]|uniref:Cyanovirin-N domain-containing protein n=1 Tax=Cephalotrichum gorgonifer TaxID=2041049 RepID=A0AAE8N3X5_9PEZI|nr:uncharacterized protein DNG_07060 [Cephalotrichum gorgonifer]
MRIWSILTALPAMMVTQALATPVPNEGDVAAPEAGIQARDLPFDCDVNWVYPTSPHMFHSNCPAGIVDGHQTWKRSEVNLNMCLTNDKGKLKWHYWGEAFHTCHKCVLTNGYSTDPVISCFCDKPGDKPQWTSIHLREGLYNQGGILKYDVFPGSSNKPHHPDR